MIYKIRGTTVCNPNSSIDDTAMVDIREDDTIVGVTMELSRDAFQGDGSYYAELSFISTNQVDQNDTQGSIHSIEIRDVADFAAPFGAPVPAENIRIFLPTNFAVSSGERIYLHFGGKNGQPTAAASTIVATAYLHSTKAGTRRATRRR